MYCSSFYERRHPVLMDFYNVRFLSAGKTIHAAQKYYNCIL